MTAPAKMTVVELREALKARGLDAGGLKPALVSRLQQALEADEAAEAGGPAAAAAAAAAAADEATTLNNHGKAAGESRATRERRRVARHPFDPAACDARVHTVRRPPAAVCFSRRRRTPRRSRLGWGGGDLKSQGYRVQRSFFRCPPSHLSGASFSARAEVCRVLTRAARLPPTPRLRPSLSPPMSPSDGRRRWSRRRRRVRPTTGGGAGAGPRGSRPGPRRDGC